MIPTPERVKIETRNFLFNEIDWSNSENYLGVTLTMKKFHRRKNDDIRSSRNFSHFMNRLNKRTFGSSGKRFNRSINRIPILEYSQSEDRYHYHTIIEIPKHSDGIRIHRERFKFMIRDSWLKTDFGYNQIDIQDLYKDNPQGWGSYITKFLNSNDQTDWRNHRWITE